MYAAFAVENAYGGFNMARKWKAHSGTAAAQNAVGRLAADLEGRGYGVKGDAHRAIGRQSKYFATLLKKPHGGATIPLESYLGLITGAGMTPSRQLARSLAGSEDPIQAFIADAEKLVDSQTNLPVVLRDAPTHGRSKLDRGLEAASSERLDALRYSNPRQVVKQTGARLRDARGPRAVASLVGIWASAQRALSRLDLASIGIGRAMALSDLFELDQVTAELARRGSAVLADRGEFAWGLSLARWAAAIYLEAGKIECFGRALIECGVLHANMGQHEDSERLCRAALGLTSSDRHHFSAHQQIAQARTMLGQHDAAERAACRAAECAPPGLQVSGRLAWLRGWIATERADLAAADRFLTSALEQLQSTALDAILVGAELVRIKARIGNRSEAQALAVSLRWFHQRLQRDQLDVDRLLPAALLDLVKAGEDARVTQQFATSIVERLKAGRDARQMRLRQRLRP